MIVTLRRFETAKDKRSKNYHQLVLATGGVSIKEIAFRINRTRRRRPTGTFDQLKAQTIPLTLVVVGIAGFAISGQQAFLSHAIEPTRNFTRTSQVTKVSGHYLQRSKPVELSIPSLNIKANIIPVGQTASGAIAMPPLAATKTVGWYEYSPTPGELGPAVIVGHVDNYETTSIFWRLHEIKPDAQILVRRADGRTAKFTVDKLSEVSQQNFPTQAVYGNIDHAGLRLITCGGNYDGATGHYSENTVVYASLASR